MRARLVRVLVVLLLLDSVESAVAVLVARPTTSAVATLLENVLVTAEFLLFSFQRFCW